MNDAECQLIEPLIPLEKPGGNHRRVDMWKIANGVFYLVHNGCTWQGLPYNLHSAGLLARLYPFLVNSAGRTSLQAFPLRA